jgi:hypothetical protein
MKGIPQKLVFGVPAPFQFEAPSSWLTRLACAQGVGSLDELLHFLELPAGMDLDWHLQGEALEQLRRRCNLAPQSFAVSGRLMEGALASGVRWDRLLLAGTDGGARFRFCPGCLAERRVPHLDIHWRFACWRWCPIHDCVLYDGCPACEVPIQHPCLIESTHAGRAGHASLSRCTRCSSRFSCTQAQQLACESVQALDKTEKLCLINGRAVLAALHRQCFKLRGKWHVVQRLGSEYAGLVGHGTGRIDRKLAAWRVTHEFLADLSDAEGDHGPESAAPLDPEAPLTTITL